MKIEITTEGQKLLNGADRFSKVLQRFRELIDQAVIVSPHELLAEDIDAELELMKAEAEEERPATPVDTGHLRESIGVDWVEVRTFDGSSVEYVPIEVRSEPEQPSIASSKLCLNCRNHHGQSYHGTFLVCGIHPYGWEGECPDWEAKPRPVGSVSASPMQLLEARIQEAIEVRNLDVIEARDNLSTFEAVSAILFVACQEYSIPQVEVSIQLLVGLEVVFSRERFHHCRTLRFSEVKRARSSGCLSDFLVEVVQSAAEQLDRLERNAQIEFHPRDNNRRLWDW